MQSWIEGLTWPSAALQRAKATNLVSSGSKNRARWWTAGSKRQRRDTEGGRSWKHTHSFECGYGAKHSNIDQMIYGCCNSRKVLL